MIDKRFERWRKRAAVVKKIAQILKTDRSTHALSVEVLAERLYTKGLRVKIQAKKERS